MSESGPGKVFISYSRVDSVFVDRLVQDLKNKGIDAWLDRVDIPAGTNWDAEIEKALLGSERVLVVLSESSCDSDNVKNEISHALELSKQVVPLVIGNGRVPLMITRLQREDFRGEYDAALSRLMLRLQGRVSRTEVLEAVSQESLKREATKLSPSAGTESTLRPAVTSEPPNKPTGKWGFAVGGAAAMFAGIVVLGIMLPDEEATQAAPGNGGEIPGELVGSWATSCQPEVNGRYLMTSYELGAGEITSVERYYAAPTCDASTAVMEIRFHLKYVKFEAMGDGTYKTDSRLEEVELTAHSAEAIPALSTELHLPQLSVSTPVSLLGEPTRAIYGFPMNKGAIFYELLALKDGSLFDGETDRPALSPEKRAVAIDWSKPYRRSS